MAVPSIARATAKAGGAVPSGRLAQLAAEVAAVRNAKLGRMGQLDPKQVAALQRKAANGEELTRVEEQLLKNIPDTGEEVADLTDVGGAEELSGVDASAIDLSSGRSGLQPNSAKVDPMVTTGEQVWQATTPADLESQSQQSLKRILREAQKYRLEDGSYDPQFLAKFPSGNRPEEALARLQVLEEMAGVSNVDRAAEQIDTAAQARAAAGAARTPSGDVGVATQNMRAAKELAGESLPQGDWNAITTAFNRLDDTQRQAVLSALPVDTRRFLTDMFDPSQPSPSFLPNRVAERTRPINDVDDLISQRNAAAAAGDTDTADEITQLLTGPGAAPQEDITDAVRAINERTQAASALRNALIGSDEIVQGEQAALRQAALSPAPKPAITPGARTPEFAADEVPAGEMPTAYDTSVAKSKEALLARDRRASGGGLPKDERLESAKEYLRRGIPAGDPRLAEIAKLTIADLPLFLKGRDGNLPFETRRQGDRANYVSPTGQKLIADANELQANVDKAYAAFDSIEGIADYRAQLQAAGQALDKANASAGRAKGAASLARATKKVEEAQAAYTAALQSNPEAFAAVRAIDAANEAMDSAVPGVSRNLRVGDRKLNRAGQAETYSDLVSGVTGFRNAPLRGTGRSSVGLDPADARRLSEQAVGEFGDDAAGLVDDASDPNFSVSPNRSTQDDSGVSIQDSGARKKTRLGGTKKESRAVDSLQRGFVTEKFGLFNPLRMKRTDGTPLFADAGAVADEILAKDSMLKKGAPSYDVAREEIVKEIEKQFSAADPVKLNAPETAVPDAPPLPSPPVDSDAPPLPSPAVESADVTDKLDASATDLGATTESAPAKKGGRRGKKSVAVKDTAERTPAEVQAEAETVFKETVREALDSGMSVEDARDAGNAARRKYVTEATKSPPVETSKPAATESPKVEGDTPADKPAATPEADAPKPDADTTKSPPVEGDEVPKPDKPADDGAPVVRKDKDGTPAPKPEEKKRSWLGLGLKAAAGAIAGGLAWDWMTPDGGGVSGGSIPDGIGGTPGGGGDFFPIPVRADGSGAVTDELASSLSEEDRINRALEKIRGGRSGRPLSSQTLQQYNAGWR